MTEFQLDTSGVVTMCPPEQPAFAYLQWSDLDPFTQGYVEALFASLGLDVRFTGDWVAHLALAGSDVRDPAFADLAPETLARIIADCKRFLSMGLGENEHIHGVRLWQMCSREQIGGGFHPEFPPLTVSLGDDGKVIFAEEVQS